jgi:hypothetical protein
MKHALLLMFILMSFSQARAYRDEIPDYGDLFVPSNQPLKASPIGESRVKDHLGDALKVSRMSSAGSGVLFSWLQLSNLPFLYPKDCCHSRAYLMSEWMAARRILNAKIFVLGDLNYHSAKYGPVHWQFHVAPAVLDEHGQWVILDPSTQSRPASLKQWLAKFAGARGTYKVYVASRFVYSDQTLMDPPAASWSDYYENIAQGELMGCEAAQNRRP